MNNNPIGVFDSGVGGLSCVPAIAKLLPNEKIIYFGDTGRAPYGSRPDSEIIDLSLDVAGALIDKGCKSLSIACNTISCVAIEAIKEKFPNIPVIGIVKPAASYVAAYFSGKRVGLIATEATVRSNAYPNAVKELGAEIDICAKATPDFVPLIEAGKAESDEMTLCIKNNLDQFVKDIDALILGCTHYPFIKNQLIKLYPHIEIIDPAYALANRTKEVLQKESLLAEYKSGDDEYIASSDSALFELIVSAIKNNIEK